MIRMAAWPSPFWSSISRAGPRNKYFIVFPSDDHLIIFTSDHVLRHGEPCLGVFGWFLATGKLGQILMNNSTTHSNTWEFSNHISPYATPMCEILLLGFCGSKVGPARKVLAVLAVRRCLSRCDGVWVCCFPCFAAQAPWRHWFGAKWTLFWENFHRREVITSQRWKASSPFWKELGLWITAVFERDCCFHDKHRP